MLMEITIIFLTILYLILTIVANRIYKFIDQTGSTLSTKKLIKLCIIGNICRVVSFIVLIIDVTFVLTFFL